MSNPFTLSFGIIPEQFISRPVFDNRIIDDFIADRPSIRAYMITGVRGSGKTVMLSEITRRLRERDDWVVVELNPEEDMMRSLASKLYNQEKIRPFFLKSKINIGYAGSGVSFEKTGTEITDEVMIEKMLGVLKKHDKKLLLAIDETSNNRYVKVFAHSFQIFLREEYPVFLIMTGLYENIYNLQNEKTLTFLYRTPRINLEPLNITRIADTYKTIFNLTDNDSLRMAKLTNGYPFAFQLLGYIQWEHRKTELNRLLPEYDQYLTDYVYEKIWRELSDTDRKVVLEIAESDDYIKIQTLREKLGMNSSRFSGYRDKLIHKGLVDVSKYGYIGLILPRFREFAISKAQYDAI